MINACSHMYTKWYRLMISLITKWYYNDRRKQVSWMLWLKAFEMSQVWDAEMQRQGICLDLSCFSMIHHLPITHYLITHLHLTLYWMFSSQCANEGILVWKHLFENVNLINLKRLFEKNWYFWWKCWGKQECLFQSFYFDCGGRRKAKNKTSLFNLTINQLN